jgi:hypothetical protein
VTNARSAAFTALARSWKKPIRSVEEMPTNSQPAKSTSMLLASTIRFMPVPKSASSTKKRVKPDSRWRYLPANALTRPQRPVEKQT